MWLCMQCEKECEGSDSLKACPNCGDTKHIPVDLEDKVTITLPWQMLRILCIWAEFWATHCRKSNPDMPKTLYQITDRIQLQHMDHSGLTLRSELSDLRGAGFDAELYDSAGEKID